MRNHTIFQIGVLICIFIVAMVLEILPWPFGFQGFKPAWIVLAITYWVLAIPNIISIGSGFILGIIWDLILGSTLGTHALVLSIFSYFLASNYLVLRNLSLWMQGLLIALLVLAIRFVIFIIEFLLHGAMFNWQEVFGALISGILWPWVFLFLRKIRRLLRLS